MTNTNRQHAAKTELVTFLYERLSRDDDDQVGESGSIANQKEFLEKFAKKNNLPNPRHIWDDGISGTRFDRPGFVKMMDEVAAGNVYACVCTDLSRWGRDHLRVGMYLEMLRENGVRFIAINDNVDSERGDDDFMPFKNIINEWAARDSSRKVKALFKSRAQDGKHVTGMFPYGYLRDANDAQRWYPDPDAASIVQRMYQMVLGGMGVYKIADTLTKEGIPTPGAHWAALGIGPTKNRELKHSKTWSGSTVRTILQKREYLGHTVNCKTYKNSYKDKRRKVSSEENLLIFENTHEALVDEETWNTVQRLIQTVRKPNKYGTVNPLTGLLWCADCGGKMTNARSIDTNGRNGGFYDNYICSKYRAFPKHQCSMHFIRTAAVERLVLRAISDVCAYVRDNRDEFVNLVREAHIIQAERDVKEQRKRMNKTQSRVKELDTLVKRLFEEYTLGKLLEKRYLMLSNDYEREQMELEAQIDEMNAALEKFAEDNVRADKFIDLVQRYTEFDELTPTLLNEFVSKIVIYEPDKSSGERKQQVDIYLNYIGQFTPPDKRDPAEVEAERIEQEKLAKKRAYHRAWYAKHKTKAAQAATA